MVMGVSRRALIVSLALVAALIAAVAISQAVPELLRGDVASGVPAIVVEDPERDPAPKRPRKPDRKREATPGGDWAPEPAPPPPIETAPVPAPAPPPPAPAPPPPPPGDRDDDRDDRHESDDDDDDRDD